MGAEGFGHRLRWARDQARLSQEKLSGRAGIARPTLSRIEVGHSGPGLAEAIMLYEALAEEVSGLSLEWFLVGTGPRESAENEAVKRRLLMQALMGVGVSLMTDALDPEPWERLARALRRPGGVDDVTVDHLEQTTLALARLEREVGPAAMVGPVTGHLNTITALLDQSLSDALRRRVYSLAGDTAALLGWLRWNLGDLAGAANYFRTGLLAADEAGDRGLALYLLGCLACRPFDREDPQARLRVLDSRSHGEATPNTQAWLANLEAGGYALLGDAERFAAASDRAAELLQQPDFGVGDRRPRHRVFDTAYLAEEHAAGLLRLGRPRDARQALEAALPDADGRLRLWMLVDLALAHIRDQEPEAACAVGHEALDGALAAGIAPITRSVAELSVDLGPFRHLPTVESLDERLAAIL